MTMDTKTTEWRIELDEERAKSILNREFCSGVQHSSDCRCGEIRAVAKALHQSRTELMRKVVGKYANIKCNHGCDINGCNCADRYYTALIKLAEDEGIEL